jgi:hypothetical protein
MFVVAMYCSPLTMYEIVPALGRGTHLIAPQLVAGRLHPARPRSHPSEVWNSKSEAVTERVVLPREIEHEPLVPDDLAGRVVDPKDGTRLVAPDHPQAVAALLQRVCARA